MKNCGTHGVHNPHEDLLNQAAQSFNALHEDADKTLKEMEKQMDRDAAEIGVTIAGLFRMLTIAYLTIPPMEYHSDSICVVRGENGITVTVRKPDVDDDCDGFCENRNDCADLADDYEEDEDYEN